MDLHLLALETSTRLCSVALLSTAGRQVSVRSLEHDATGEHAERVLPMADSLLRQAGLGRSALGAVAFGQGPGGFTGLRVACGVVQGIAFALGLPVIPVVSLQAIAAQDESTQGPRALAFGRPSPIYVVVQHARMNEVYLAAYRWSGALDDPSRRCQALQPPVLLGADDVALWLHQAIADWSAQGEAPPPVRLLGDAVTTCAGLMTLAADEADATEPGTVTAVGSPRLTAETIARVALAAWRQGQWVRPELAAPLYVRDKIAYTTLERAQGWGGNPRAHSSAVTMAVMTEHDLDAVANIESQVQSHPWSRGNFADALKSGCGAWVARCAGQTTGFCVMMFAPDVAHILVLAVTPQAQRKGIGSLFLDACERECAQRGLPSIILEVRPSNLQALAFYRLHGFDRLSVRKAYYPLHRDQREDAWVMEKKLIEKEMSNG